MSSGSNQLTRHTCYKEYLAKKGVKEEKEEDRSMEEEEAAEAVEAPKQPPLDLKSIVQGLLFANNADGNSDGSGGSGDGETVTAQAHHDKDGDNDEDDLERLPNDADGSGGSNGGETAQANHDSDGDSDDSEDDDELAADHREILVDAIKKYGDICVQSSHSLGFTALNEIVPHEWTVDAWENFVDSVQALNINQADSDAEPDSSGNHVVNDATDPKPSNVTNSKPSNATDPKPSKAIVAIGGRVPSVNLDRLPLLPSSNRKRQSNQKDSPLEEKKKKKDDAGPSNLADTNTKTKTAMPTKRALEAAKSDVPSKKVREAASPPPPSTRVLRKRK